MKNQWIAFNVNCPEINKIFDSAEEAMNYTHSNGKPIVIWEITGFGKNWGTGRVYILGTFPNRKPQWFLNKQSFLPHNYHCEANKAILTLQKILEIKLT